MKLSVSHRTTYRFSRPLISAIEVLRLTPLSCTSQTVLDWRIDVSCNARLREACDGYGNCTHTLYIGQPVSELTITAGGTVITEDRAGVVEALPADLPAEVFLRTTSLTEPNEELRGLADAIWGDSTDVLDRLHALNAELRQSMTFDAGATTSGTSAAEAYVARRGVCQDFAHIFIAAVRSRGIPCRYVSGYLFRRDGAAQDAGHAWVEAWVPTLGWVAFDPTHGICADDAYVRVATGLDYCEAAPITGARRGGGTEGMSVDIAVSGPSMRSQRQTQRQSRHQRDI